jgi:hypothetical protein
MDWKKVSMVEGWTIRRDQSGYTLTAQVYASDPDALPTRGSSLTTASGLTCAVPSQFKAYLVNDVEITPLTGIGPYLATVTARAHLSASGNKSDSLLSQNSVSAGYQDFHIKPSYCALKDHDGGDSTKPIGERWMSAFANDASATTWNSWKTKTLPDCPFKYRPHNRFADETLRFLAVTVRFNQLEGDGIEDWANFQGVIPVGSIPSWIRIPRGENRWRLWDETYEMGKDTDGKRILRATRVLLGIPSFFKDEIGRRCEWDDDKLGQKKWGSLI